MICHSEAYEYICNLSADSEKKTRLAASMPLVRCPQGCLDLGQMMRIHVCLAKIV